jgi:hypothetical protein
VRLEDLGQLKNPTTSSRIEPANFRLAALCLNHLRDVTLKNWCYIVPKFRQEFFKVSTLKIKSTLFKDFARTFGSYHTPATLTQSY